MATFGIRFLDHLAPAKTLVEWAVLAEQKGFDFCWFHTLARTPGS
jgi:hypothetical protein